MKRVAVVAFSRWWDSDKMLGPAIAWANILVGLASAICAALDIKIGLGTFARPFFAYFAVLSVGWGLLALRLGRAPRTARPLRLGGDILAWLALIGFSLLGLFAADEAETGPLVTLAIFVVITTAVAARGIWADVRSPT